jgi:hypothetical protein
VEVKYIHWVKLDCGVYVGKRKARGLKIVVIDRSSGEAILWVYDRQVAKGIKEIKSYLQKRKCPPPPDPLFYT